MTEILAYQPTFRPPLPDIYGCADYREQRELLVRIDELIQMTHADIRFQALCIERFDEWNQLSDEAKSQSPWIPNYNPYSPTGKLKESWLSHTITAFRTNILRFLIDSPVRDMSFKMSDSSLTRWFCCVSEFGKVKPPAKSTIHRYVNWVDCESIKTSSPILSGRQLV